MRILSEIKMADTISRKELTNFIEERKLLEICMESCEMFHKTDRKLEAKKFSMVMMETGLTLIEQARVYLEFLFEINFVHETFKLDKAKIDTLWTLYFTKAFSLEHENVLWNIR